MNLANRLESRRLKNRQPRPKRSKKLEVCTLAKITVILTLSLEKLLVILNQTKS
jgi:hypothetical protein